MFGLLFMLGSMAFTAWGSSQQRKEMNRQADERERKINEEMAFKTSLAVEQSHDILVGAKYERGEARAIQATSGTAVGVGSNIPQVDNIAARARKKMEVLRKRISFEGDVTLGDVREIRHRKDAGIESSYWQQGATMLAQGYQLGLSEGWWGVDIPSDQGGATSGQSGFDQSGGMSGMSGQGYWRGL